MVSGSRFKGHKRWVVNVSLKLTEDGTQTLRREAERVEEEAASGPMPMVPVSMRVRVRAMVRAPVLVRDGAMLSQVESGVAMKVEIPATMMNTAPVSRKKRGGGEGERNGKEETGRVPLRREQVRRGGKEEREGDMLADGQRVELQEAGGRGPRGPQG